jgi:hypothetical protein
MACSRGITTRTRRASPAACPQFGRLASDRIKCDGVHLAMMALQDIRRIIGTRHVPDSEDAVVTA